MNASLNSLFRDCVLLMHGTDCVMCGKDATAIHHLYEKGIGGCSLNQRYNPLNGVPLCHGCHTRIHSAVGEVMGRYEIFRKIPQLMDVNYKTHPFKSENITEVRKELESILKELLNEKRINNK